MGSSDVLKLLCLSAKFLAIQH